MLTPRNLCTRNRLLTRRGASTCGALTPRSSSATPRGGTLTVFAPSSLHLPLHLLAEGQPSASPCLAPTSSSRTTCSTQTLQISTGAAQSPSTFSTAASIASTPAADEVPGLREAFQRFAAFGQGSAKALDGMRWAKLARERLLDSGLTPTRADLIFKEVTAKAGVRKLSFRLFLTALGQAAKACSVASAELAGMVAAAAGPLVNGSLAPTCSAIAPEVLKAASAESIANA